MTSKPSPGIAAVSEKALELIRWQPLQWQAMVTSGGAVTRNRTLPHRQPPSQGVPSRASLLSRNFRIVIRAGFSLRQRPTDARFERDESRRLR